MTKLIANFKRDLISAARQRLTDEWGCDSAQYSDERALITFLGSARRRPAIRPRSVWVADDFFCPQDQDDGWKMLREKILNGADLGPHLSLGHMSVANLDGLLNEWGVHHFHLGTRPHHRSPYHVERSPRVLFALVRDDDFYAVNVYRHDGDWEQSSIIDSVHRNWPHVISRYEVHGIQGEPLTHVQRRRIRKSNFQTTTAASDGKVYISIGGGVSGSGNAIEAIVRAAKLLDGVERLQAAVQEQIQKFIPHLRTRGYTVEPEIRAKLDTITELGYVVLFPEYELLVSTKLRDASALEPETSEPGAIQEQSS